MRYEEWLLRQTSRRRFLQRAGLLTATLGAAPAFLAACGDDDEPAQESGNGGDGPAAAPKASGRVDYLSWEAYDLPEPLKRWKRKNGVEVKATYIGNHNDIQAKLKGSGGGGGFDLITYYQGYKPLYSQLEILEPLDENKIPNLSGLLPFFAGDEGNFWVDEDGTRTGVPFTWGSFGITYDSEAIKQLPSWYDLLDPKLKGKVGMVDDFVGNWTLGARINGLKVDELDDAGYQKVRELLLDLARQTRGVSASYGDLTTQLVNGDVVAAWTGWAAVNQFAKDAGKDTVKTNLPKEGSSSFCDAYAIPPGADNADTVYSWINEALDPVVNARAAEFLVGGVTVEAAIPELNKATASLYPYDKLDELLKQAPLFNNPPVESDQYKTFEELQRGWEEIKSEAQA
jgi:spermidine/putrescine transport system substrate-binding protein